MIQVLSDRGVPITPPDIHPKRLADMPTYEILFPFGDKNHGKPFTRIPNRDLRRYARRKSKWGYVAQRELKRRGTNYVDDPVELSFHSIDRISQELLDLYVERDNPAQGLKTWAVELAARALATGETDAKGRYVMDHIKFVFDFRPRVPVLVTILDNRGDWIKKRVTTEG